MLNTTLDLLWPALLGTACGALAFALLMWRRAARPRREHLLPAPRTLPAAWPLDTHLCLNVLGRFALALDEDESAQQGLEHLGDYLAACHRAAQATVDSGRMAHVRQVVDQHWMLSCWREGRPARPIAWQLSGEVATQEGVLLLIDSLRQLLASPHDGDEAPLVRVDVQNQAVGRDGEQVALLQLNPAVGHPATARSAQVRWPVPVPCLPQAPTDGDASFNRPARPSPRPASP